MRLRWEDLEGLSLHQQRQKLLERMANSEVAQEKFWKKVERRGPNDCWIWTGAQDENGYGNLKMMVNYVSFGFRSHRVAFYLVRGFMPPDTFACHKCDVPLCVNPDHLFLGGQHANQADKVMKDRQAFGEKHGRSKLTVAQVQEARLLRLRDKISIKALAQKFGLSCSSMASVLDGTHWSRVPFPDLMDDPMF